ncbi:MAG: glycosyltransferase [Parafilimonas terrae]|nr:glycosyltransferase [Parafilimonas terrae]
MPAPKLIYFVTEDWFFVSHFLSVAKAAQRDGFDVAVHVRIANPALQARIEADGIRVLPSRHERGHFGPLAMVAHVWRFAALMRAERPAIVHLVSVRLIVLAGLAAVLAGVPARVQAVTGLGLLGASRSAKARLARALLGALLRGPLGGRRAAYVFENREDPVLLGMDPDGPAVTVVGGAGVDPETERAQPLPSSPPLKLAVVARMIFSKGVDLAVEAVRQARAAGVDVTLTLVGASDPQNPKAIAPEQLEAWNCEPGIRWAGASSDIRAVWRDHHVVCVPSRGGEGLPRALLEGAAAGRAVLTTATPGCATFVRDGVEGFVVPPDNAGALAGAIARLAADPALVARFGAAARARIFDGFTQEAVATGFLAVYCRLAESLRR